MANEGETLDISGDVAQHPPVDHPGRLAAEQKRTAAQTQGGPLSSLKQGLQNLQGDVQRAGQGWQQLTGARDRGRPQASDGGQDGENRLEQALQEPGRLAGAALGALAGAPPPPVLDWLGKHPAYGDNPWMPYRAMDPVAEWQRTVRLGRAWRVLVNPDLVSSSVNDILNEHTWQGQLKRLVLGMDSESGAWIWRNIMPQLLVMSADSNPVTAGLDLAGQASQDPTKAAAQAWAQLPWQDYANIAHLLVTHPDQVSPELVGAAFWKQFTAALTIGAVLPELRFLGEGRLALALPWRKYMGDAVEATRRLPIDPDLPPPNRLGELARSVEALRPTIVRAGRTETVAATAVAPRAAPLVDLSRHLEQIRNSVAEAGPSQDRASELMNRLRLLNVRDQPLEDAYKAFASLKKGDFGSHAEFAGVRQQRWDAMMQALSKADASKVQMPSALNFLEAVDLDTLPTRTLRQLTKLAHEEIADRAVQRATADQAAKYQRRTMQTLFRGLYGRDFTRRLREQGVRPTEDLMRQLLPHMLPHMSEGQQAFLRAIWNKYMDYDLRRLHPEDVQPRALHEYLDEVSAEARPHAQQLIGSTYGVLAFIQGGPHMLEDNAIESLVQSLLNRQRAHEAMLGEFFFPQLAAVADAGGVDLEQAMRAIRDDAAFEGLSPEGRMIVDAWRHIQLLLRDRAMAVGARSDFVGRFDPRVPVREAEDEASGLLPRLRAGQSPIGTTSKAHRTEVFQLDPEDPTRLALGEKYRTVFDLNAAMEEARSSHVASLMGQGEDRLTAEIAARRRYPTYHTNLAYALYEYLAPELRALNAHQAVQELLYAFTEDGSRLAYQRAERAAPAAYRPLRTAGRAFQNVLFHPKFADAIDKANEHVSLGRFEAVARVNSEAKQGIMLWPQIHALNVAGRVLPMMLTHPWAAIEELLGHDMAPGLEGLDRQTRRMYRAMEAMQNGVVPHKAARELFTNVMTELGNATGDSRMFEVPTGAQAEGASKFIRDKARQMPGLVGRVTPGWLQHLNDIFWRAVWAFQVFAYHVEQRALRARMPKMDPARVNLYAAFRANRWGGAIEPENWSQFGYHASRMLMFAPNWLRSFLELQLPVYLRGELAASQELRRYVWEQEMRSMVAMLAGQQITGNAMNYLLSGHSLYQNQPQNRNRIEIDPSNPYSPGRMVYDALHGVDPALVAGVDPDTGVNPKNGAPLTWENPFARQQTQIEQGLSVPYFGDQTADQPAAGETFAASHASPIVQALAMAANVDIYKTARNGGRTMEHVDPQGWNPSVLWPALLQLTPMGYSFGGAALQAAHDTAPQAQEQPGAGQPGQEPTWQDQWKAWAKDLPVPQGYRDMVAAMPDSAVKTLISNIMGVQSPYEKAETSKGTRMGDVQDARLQEVLATHHQVMAQHSQDMFSGKDTPYQWRQWYQSYVPNYDGQLQSYFQGSPEYTRGQLGLYHKWQQTYADAELPDHSGIDWGKLEQKQAEFRSQHSDAEMQAIAAYQAQTERDYPALRMYREVTENHRAEQRIWARQLGMTDVQLSKMLSDYGQVAGDRRAQGAFYAQHPQMTAYLRQNEDWEINNPYGRMYSLYYHTAAMRRWLAAAGETEQQGARQLEQEFR